MITQDLGSRFKAAESIQSWPNGCGHNDDVTRRLECCETGLQLRMTRIDSLVLPGLELA